MPALKYITKSDSNPRGKPRVYFCCHPREHAAFLKPISQELLARQNCALWYTEDPDQVRDEDLWADLSQMQLFVMPVTTRLLTTENPAMEEFRFAIRSHIPVLPLMQESGLEELFNEKCGDLQFLDSNARDDTAISYEEKLEKYLSSVLIGDELAEKVRSAFDAYVFLSYRKKDRRHAQELMRLIHSNDFARDIAIWYDEFLTPGENFNDAIREALEKSHLFALTVTPNLVNEDNYIRQHEYPMAKGSKKPILPVEMVFTDRVALEDQYEDIPACTDGHDAPALSDALLARLRQLALRENDSDPVHNYLIGLAYQSGIDVEVNHDRALELITSAAESDLIEANTQLVHMYRTGLGVERNYETAVFWQEKKIELLERQYKLDPAEENLHTLFWETINCGDFYRDLGKISLAMKKYEAAAQKAEDNRGASRRMERALAVGFGRLGNLCMNEDDLPAAKAFLESAHRIFEDRVREWDIPGDRRDLAISLRVLGEVHEAQGDLKAARHWFEECLAIDDAMASKVDYPEARRGVALSCEKLGDICKAEMDYAAAKDFYGRSMDILEELAERGEVTDISRSLGIHHEKLGEICKAEGNLAGAREHHQKAMEIFDALAAETGTMDARRCLAISCHSLAALCMTEGDLSGAEAHVQKGLDILTALAEEASTVETRRDLAISCGRLGDIRKRQGDLDGAKVLYARQLTLDEALAEETGTVRCRRGVAISCGRMGDLCRAEGDLAAARGYYKRSVELDEALAEETGTVEARWDLAISYERMGDLHKEEDDLSAAKDCYGRSLTIREALTAETGTMDARRNLSISCEKMGILYRAQREKGTATKYFKRSLELRRMLAEEYGTAQAKEDLALSHCFMATQSLLRRRWHFRKARRIMEALLVEEPENKRFRSTLADIDKYL